MLEQIARVLFWLGAGELLTRLLAIPVPGSVMGLVLLYLELSVRRDVPPALERLAGGLLQLLGLLFVPAGVGVVTHLDVLKSEALPILTAVLGGTAVTILTTTLAASRFAERQRRRNVSLVPPSEEAQQRVQS